LKFYLPAVNPMPAIQFPPGPDSGTSLAFTDGILHNDSSNGEKMKKKRVALRWEGAFLELCMGRITADQQNHMDAHGAGLSRDVQSLWYENPELLRSVFQADNWWSVDDLDHAMGLVFADRPTLDKALATIGFEIDGTPVSVDPDSLQLSFYAPEPIDQLKKDDRVVCHGIRRQAVLHLEAEIAPPFDPSVVALSFQHYADYGHILIDIDIDGHDDVRFTWGDTTYLPPRFLGKEHFDDTSR
jgi:hypothetical protein